ncbi:unnamed protein product [Mytilus coruscus]|uniref:Uncharacterized protein n=1 Tax=Mytilus coruscus TaxID=42192 RepID=A0A6J8CSL1_MYTCO|nr:unnamed protein product [Mytilus coruscus]
MDDDNFDCRSVHSDMGRIEYNKIKGKENTTKGLTQSRCQSESGLHTGTVRNDDSEGRIMNLRPLSQKNRSLALDIYHLRKQVDSSTHELDLSKHELETVKRTLGMTKEITTYSMNIQSQSITGISSSASHPDEPKFRLPFTTKSDFQSFGVSLKLELGSSIGTTVNR